MSCEHSSSLDCLYFKQYNRRKYSRSLRRKKKVASLIIAQLNSRISAVNSIIGRNAVWSRTGKTINVKNGSIFSAGRCTFHNNIASIGGATSCEGNSSIVWTNSIFSHNKGNDYGGALHSEDCVVTIENCSMTFNSIMHLKGSCIASHRDILQVSTHCRCRVPE